ncbi:alpha-L-fucosidase [Streptomyces sp. MAR4 CNX-425]|uniref:alpha-L-fucosidase n=1 Tax=Streptomyces sp. MAR4 CNX-425 TaxID=3406343 RepID=UPI003B50B9FF
MHSAAGTEAAAGTATTAAPPPVAPAPAAAAGGTRPVVPASRMAVEDGDTPERVVAKAAHIVPTPAQLAWQRREVTAFTHFGMNTLTDREWGSGAEDPALFDPGRVDVAQWMRTYRAMGAETAMLTVKHHDGFSLYPTRYSDHSVAASPHSRDLLGTYVREARRAGLGVGVYLSPSDGAELPHAWHADWLAGLRAKREAGEPLTDVERTALADGGPPSGHGRYGNGSPVRTHTVPTLVEGDDRADDVAAGRLPAFTVRADDYDAYFLNQLYELFTEYGPIDELWLDGANPWRDAGVTQEYGFRQWYELIHALSPDTVVFQGPLGVRWVGNERGVARETEWSVTPHAVDPRSTHGALPDDSTGPDIGSRARLLADGVKYLQWYPAEADVSHRPGWFHHPGERPKTADELFALYERSVGRNAPLLLNVPPARDGRIAAEDVRELHAFGDRVRAVYGTNVLERGGPQPFDRVRLAEDIRHGQRVERFAVEAADPATGEWREIAAGTTIGAYRILPLPEPVTAERLRVRVDEARAEPRLLPVTAHLSTAPAAR